MQQTPTLHGRAAQQQLSLSAPAGSALLGAACSAASGQCRATSQPPAAAQQQLGPSAPAASAGCPPAARQNGAAPASVQWISGHLGSQWLSVGAVYVSSHPVHCGGWRERTAHLKEVGGCIEGHRGGLVRPPRPVHSVSPVEHRQRKVLAVGLVLVTRTQLQAEFKDIWVRYVSRCQHKALTAGLVLSRAPSCKLNCKESKAC